VFSNARTPLKSSDPRGTHFLTAPIPARYEPHAIRHATNFIMPYVVARAAHGLVGRRQRDMASS